MAKAKARGKPKGGSSHNEAAAPGRPRNPFAIVVRRRAAGPEPSPRTYRRRPKHTNPKPDIKPED